MPDRKPIFDEIDPEQIALDCVTDEPYERIVRFMVRSRYGALKPVGTDDLPDVRGATRVGSNPSIDLLRLTRAIELAVKRAHARDLSAQTRILRHNEVDSLRDAQRYLLNAEAGEKYCVYDLELRTCGPVVVICTTVRLRK